MLKYFFALSLLFISSSAFASASECVKAIEAAATRKGMMEIHFAFKAIPRPLSEVDRLAVRGALFNRARSGDVFIDHFAEVYDGDLYKEFPEMLVELNILPRAAQHATSETVAWLLSLPSEPMPAHFLAIYRVVHDLVGRKGFDAPWYNLDQEYNSAMLSQALKTIAALDPKQPSFDVKCFQAAVTLWDGFRRAGIADAIDASIELELLSEWARLIRGELSAAPSKPGDPTPIALHSYIAEVMQYISPEMRIESLQKLIGLEVSGQHKHFPEGKTATERRRIGGVIQSIQVAAGKPEGMYEMVLASDAGPTTYLFSGTTSPSFPILETKHVADASLAREIANSTRSRPLDILEIGLDTPPDVAAYKQALRDRYAIAFYGSRSVFSEFSNFYEAAIVIDDVSWPSSEHYFQASKFFGTDAAYAEAIRNTLSPARAAEMGRDRTKVLRSDWEQVKDDVMYRAIEAKFSQYPHLRAVLLSTDDAELVEHTERDRYWGDGENGRGNAMLGKLLVRLREKLRRG